MASYPPSHPPIDDSNEVDDSSQAAVDVPRRERILRWGKLPITTFQPSNRHGHCGALVGDSLYVIGGMEAANRTNKTAVLNTVTKKWTQPLCDGTGRDVTDLKGEPHQGKEEGKVDAKPQPLPPPRVHAASFVWGPSIYIHGGEGASYLPVKNDRGSDADMYLPEGMEDLNEAFTMKKQFIEKVVLSDTRPPRTCLDDCWVLDTSKHPLAWRSIPSKLSPLPRKSHTCSVVSHDNFAIVLLFAGAPSGRKEPSNALYWVRVSDLEGEGGGSMGEVSSSRMALWHR